MNQWYQEFRKCLIYKRTEYIGIIYICLNKILFKPTSNITAFNPLYTGGS